MKKINIALIGFGTVGQGVVKYLRKEKSNFKNKFGVEYFLKTICDRSINKKDTSDLSKIKLTTNIDDILNDTELDVVIELIGGMNPAKKIVSQSLEKGRHVITANKELIANCGPELFAIAQKNHCHLLYESAVGAGIPVIKTITEGIVGNSFQGVYGIVNGTCNFILSEMSSKGCTFDEALKDAQAKGYAESDPTLDINGMDAAHKLGILVNLAFNQSIAVKDIYTEGITQISKTDIEYAEKLGLCIKLLAIAKCDGNEFDARVHPTLISKSHPLASIHSIFNAIYLESYPLGNILLSGEGAGQMAAASGVISDLINLIAIDKEHTAHCNINLNQTKLKLRKIDDIKTKFYLRFMAGDKPGVLSKITGVLGNEGIGINSVTQNPHLKTQAVPVIMLTDYTTEKSLRKALNQIHKMPEVKAKPVAIRMEKLW